MIETKYHALAGSLNEATLRLWLATEANVLGRGGVSTVAKATGVSRTTIYAGIKELQSPGSSMRPRTSEHRVRAKGGGRKKLTAKDVSLLEDLDARVAPSTRGDPMSPLRWTCKSTPRLAKELEERGHRVSQRTVCDLLAQLGISLGLILRHRGRDVLKLPIPVRIRATFTGFSCRLQTVTQIAVDTKKKELVGDCKNGGREWQPEGHPEEVRVYDFMDAELGKVVPLWRFRRDRQPRLGECRRRS